MMHRFPQLQSGFVTHSENLIEKTKPQPEKAIRTLLNADHFPRSQEDYFYSPTMDSMVNEAIQNPLCLRNYKFQQDLFMVVSRLFDKQSFVAFIRLQEKNPQISTAHRLFLEETARVALGLQKQRTVSLQSWASMLSTANDQTVKLYRTSDSLANIFNETSPNKDINSLDAFVLSWIRNAGFHDFIISMQVIFGRRSLHASFGNRR